MELNCPVFCFISANWLILTRLCSCTSVVLAERSQNEDDVRGVRRNFVFKFNVFFSSTPSSLHELLCISFCLMVVFICFLWVNHIYWSAIITQDCCFIVFKESKTKVSWSYNGRELYLKINNQVASDALLFCALLCKTKHLIGFTTLGQRSVMEYQPVGFRVGYLQKSWFMFFLYFNMINKKNNSEFRVIWDCMHLSVLWISLKCADIHVSAHDFLIERW